MKVRDGTMRFNSARVILTCSIAGFLALLVAVSISAIAGLMMVDHHLEAINRKWLIGTQLLGEVKNTAGEFRVVESHRTLAADQPSAIQAEFQAERYATKLDEILTRYEAVAGRDVAADDLVAFKSAWAAYLKQHRDWIAAAAGGVIERSIGYGSPLQKRYDAVQLAGANLIDDAKAAANAEAAAADRLADRTTKLVTFVVVLAAILAIGLIALVDLRITTPLGAITRALTRLAAGHRDTRVPELHRGDEIGAMAKAFEVFRANAAALAEAQEQAEALARHDPLTGLPNRRVFASELDAALGRCAVDGFVFAVMLIDLDQFKPVNDLHGHAAGDRVLCEIATRLRELVGSGGIVARLGGDEFAIITSSRGDRRAVVATAIDLATRIVTVVGGPIDLDQARVQVGASIGISIAPLDGSNTEDVLRTADLAMYRAKHVGRGTFRFFEDSMDEELRTRVALETDVRVAVENGDFEPHYQPLVDLASDRIAGFEMLARWRHPVRGAVAPDVFIPVVERLGLLDQMTAALLRRTIRDAETWDPRVRVSVNISPAQFQHPPFASKLAAILRTENFEPRRLEIEVTETALVSDLKAARHTLEQLQRLGVTVVLDDFGTGYSSLSHLREFRFDKIKIDRSFIRSMTQNADSQLIVDAVIGLARNLGLPTVAEGIENAEIRHLIASRGCEYGQGYWFSKAVPADVATDMLKNQSGEPRRAAG